MECIVSSAQVPYSIFNITEVYNNCSFRSSFPNGSSSFIYTDLNITISNGFYTIEDLDSYMQQYAITNGIFLVDNNGT
jgi:hypothetical protein